MATGITDVRLNQEQKKAVTHGEGPLLIVAGAGTGKTTVITQRIFWLIQEGKAKPEEILALTFTEKATEEMVTRVDQLLPYGYVQLWISTFHALGERILKEHGLDIGLPNDFRIVNTIDAWILVRRNLDRFHLDYYRPLGNPAKFIHALVQHFSRCKDEAIDPENYVQYAEKVRLDKDHTGDAESAESEGRRLQEVADAYHTYQQILLENSALDFGDLLTHTLRLFHERPKILAQYRERFKYILVDEFQDTNWAQYEIVKLLAAPKNNVAVVADDDQAIYRWRGASMSNILQFQETYPDATEIVLTKNYRSRQNILDRSYHFIQKNNPNRLEVRLHTPKKLSAAREGAGIVEHLRARTETEEAKLVAEKILALQSKEKAAWSDFAVLVRANNQAEAFVRSFERHGIPYQFLASKGLYTKPIILDCLAYLRLLDNYHESPAFYRLLVSPVLNVDEQDIVKLMHIAGRKNESLFTLAKNAGALGLAKESLAKLQTLLGWITRHTQLARKKTVGEVLYTFLNDSGYLKELTKDVQHPEARSFRAYERVQHIERFFKEIAAFEHVDPEPTVQRFLETFTIREEAGEQGSLQRDFENGPETVKIMTVHGAKGLEFRYVFLPQLVELRFPSVDRKEPIDIPDALVKEIVPEGNAHLEEERRLFYVAMTRAKDGVFFSSAEDYGGLKKKRPSQFLVEAGVLKKARKQESKKATDSQQTVLAQYRKKEDAKEAKAALPLPKHFSYTQLKAFETCPLQYKFAHILKIPVRGRFTFSFGKSMHSTLQKFFQKIMDAQKSEQQDLFGSKNSKFKIQNSKFTIPTLDELLKIYEESWLDDWYESKKHEEEYFARGRAILKEFYALHERSWPETIAIEQPFTMKIGSYTLKGVIDRIDRVGDGVAVLDYKTGKTPNNERSLEREQLFLYQLAVQETMHETPTSLVYYFLDEQKSFSFVGTEKELAEVREKVLATLQKIETSDFAATPSPMICRNCDFKEICEYRQL